MAVHPDDRRPEVRAGDADREEVIERLRSHVAEGRLSIDEFEDRVALVWVARTFGDLDRITDDLPVPATTTALAPTTPPRRSGPPIREREHSDKSTAQVAATFAVISIFLILIWVLTGFGGYFWPIWPMMGFGLVIGLKAVNSSR